MPGKLPDLDVEVDALIEAYTDVDANVTALVNANTQLQHASDIRVDTSNVKLAIVEPIRTESKLDTDSSAKLQSDLCLTLKLAELPTTCVSRPFHYELVLSLFRFPLLGLSLAGKDEVKIDGSPQKTFTVGPKLLGVHPARKVRISAGGLHVRPGAVHGG